MGKYLYMQIEAEKENVGVRCCGHMPLIMCPLLECPCPGHL